MARALPATIVALIAACGPSTAGEVGSMEATRQKYEAIRRERLHAGMTREEVTAVLGAPTDEDAKGMHYDVGGYWLDVQFDEQGNLRETLLDPY